MLPARNRLPRYGFSQLPKLSRAHSANLTLLYAENAAVGGFAVIVPKKVVRKAVDRHLLKRRLRATMTPFISPNRAAVLMAKVGALTTPASALQHEAQSLLTKAFPRT